MTPSRSSIDTRSSSIYKLVDLKLYDEENESKRRQLIATLDAAERHRPLEQSAVRRFRARRGVIRWHGGTTSCSSATSSDSNSNEFLRPIPVSLRSRWPTMMPKRPSPSFTSTSRCVDTR